MSTICPLLPTYLCGSFQLEYFLKSFFFQNWHEEFPRVLVHCTFHSVCSKKQKPETFSRASSTETLSYSCHHNMQIVAAPEMLMGNVPEGWKLALLLNTILVVECRLSCSFERNSQNMQGTFLLWAVNSWH